MKHRLDCSVLDRLELIYINFSHFSDQLFLHGGNELKLSDIYVSSKSKQQDSYEWHPK